MKKFTFFNFTKVILLFLFIFNFSGLFEAHSIEAVLSKISAKDRITIRVLEQENLGGVYVVSEKGTIKFPLINKNLEAAGMTYEEFADLIKKELEKEYFYKATVLVAPEGGLEYTGPQISAGGTVYVYGKVSRQGALKLPKGESLTVSKVIIKSGGFAEFANRRQVKLVRKSSVDGKASTVVLNMVDIIDNGKLEKDVEVRDGDTIVVPEQFFNF